MPRRNDITDLLKEWPYDPDDYVREVTGADGQPKLQVRFPMGIEQYELDGRPDGLRPQGRESSLDCFLHKRDQATTRAAGSGEEFRLSPEDCEVLRDEALIYYYRYDLLYMKKDYERVIRDTARNILAFDLIAHCAEHPEDRESMEMYRPFALRLHFAARALVSAKRGRHDEALRQVRMGIAKLEELPSIDDPRWRRELKTATAFLRRLERRLHRAKPLTPRQRLQRELKRAVDREDYESAAKLRDRLAALRDNEAGTPPSQ